MPRSAATSRWGRPRLVRRMIWRRSWNLRSVVWRKACSRRLASRSERWRRITVERSHLGMWVGLLSLRTEPPQRPDKPESISGFVYEYLAPISDRCIGRTRAADQVDAGREGGRLPGTQSVG